MNLLKMTATAIGSGAMPSVDMWFSIPGGLIYGKAVSKEEMSKHAQDIVREQESPGDANNVIQQEQKRALELMNSLEEHGDLEDFSDTIISLVDATFFSNDVIGGIDSAYVEISNVSAWGFGTAPPNSLA